MALRFFTKLYLRCASQIAAILPLFNHSALSNLNHEKFVIISLRSHIHTHTHTYPNRILLTKAKHSSYLHQHIADTDKIEIQSSLSPALALIAQAYFHESFIKHKIVFIMQLLNIAFAHV